MTFHPVRSRILAALIVLSCARSGAQAAPPENDLIHAAGWGDLARIKALLAAKADVNATAGNGMTALIAASVGGYEQIV